MSKLPFLSSTLNKEVEKARAEFKTTLEIADPKFYKNLPPTGWEDKAILKRLETLSKIELDRKAQGNYSGAVYTTKQELMDLSKEAVSKFLYTNVLFYDMHPSSRQIENETVAMVLDMFDGLDTGASGLATSGGSESILLALLAHKRYYKKKKGITKPHIIMSETAHAAFYKAAEFFDLETTVLQVNTTTFTVTPDQYRKAITKNTICMIGSAPCVAYGSFDPLKALD
jgi:sphinganine-1-phosphate aldolase